MSRAPCYDCEREAPRKYLQRREVVIPNPPGESGYVEAPVLLCSECIGKRCGYNCPQCGVTHSEKENARYCCKRRPGEAPDCRECGRRMERGAWGVTASGEQTVEWAECEGCGIGWGRFTGWEQLEQEEPEQ